MASTAFGVSVTGLANEGRDQLRRLGAHEARSRRPNAPGSKQESSDARLARRLKLVGGLVGAVLQLKERVLRRLGWVGIFLDDGAARMLAEILEDLPATRFNRRQRAFARDLARMVRVELNELPIDCGFNPECQ